ncbi:MAG: hypothetical protein IJM38_04060 [Ruminococcus sp.]|nr:hypothetical protein [Ruminococcus sp.]
MADVKSWKVTVGEDVIEVSSKGLFVNGKLQDTGYGITTCSRFEGRLPNGKLVRTVMGADGLGFKIHCTIFVDYECVLQD